MIALFVHGMGRSPLSGWSLMNQLKRSGLKPQTFGYFVSRESFTDIQQRLKRKIMGIAKNDDYIVIGHSLGGVLIRAVLNELSQHTPAPKHVFLLGSPLQSSRLAKIFTKNSIFRTITKDCGALLASEKRMSNIGNLNVPTTSIVGVSGIGWKYAPFYGKPNDGIVSLDEVSAEWLTDQVQLPIVHALLPSSKKVTDIILNRIAI